MKKEPTVTDLIEMTTTKAAIAIRPESLKLKQRLTLEATSIARLQQVICVMDGELESIEMPSIGKDGHTSTAIAVPITDVVAGSQYLLICNSLVVSALQRAGSPLRGRYFAIKSGEIKAGKRYRQVDVIELEVAE